MTFAIISQRRTIAIKINRPFGQEGYTHTKGAAFRNKKLDFFEPYAILRYFCDILQCLSQFCDIFFDSFCDIFCDKMSNLRKLGYYRNLYRRIPLPGYDVQRQNQTLFRLASNFLRLMAKSRWPPFASLIGQGPPAPQQQQREVSYEACLPCQKLMLCQTKIAVEVQSTSSQCETVGALLFHVWSICR